MTPGVARAAAAQLPCAPGARWCYAGGRELALELGPMWIAQHLVAGVDLGDSGGLRDVEVLVTTEGLMLLTDGVGEPSVFVATMGDPELEDLDDLERPGIWAMGAAAMDWSEIPPGSDGFTFKQGERYAVLASVSKNFTLAQVQSYMTSNGWDVTYAWEYGTPTRNQYDIDTWLAGLPADTHDNHRWIYGEADRTGPDWTKGQDAPWPLTVYEIAHVFQAVPAPAGQQGGDATFPSSTAPLCPAPPSTTGYLVGGAVAGSLATLLVRAMLRL